MKIVSSPPEYYTVKETIFCGKRSWVLVTPNNEDASLTEDATKDFAYALNMARAQRLHNESPIPVHEYRCLDCNGIFEYKGNFVASDGVQCSRCNSGHVTLAVFPINK